MERTMKKLPILALAATAAFVAALSACSSEPPAAPSRPPTPAPTDTADAGTDGAGPGACFDTTKEKPTRSDHFLNQCNAGECFAFDNAARIEGFKPGQALPPLN
jgi:hypothetical protein